jgi:hypothetical protein
MSVSSNSTSTVDGVSRSSKFLECCAKVWKNDPTILPEPGEPIRIGNYLSKKEHMELADAFLENTNVTYLELDTAKFTKSSAEAIAKYVSTSKHLQRMEILRWMIEHGSSVKRYSVVFYMLFKKARRSRNYSWNCLPGMGRPT